MPSLPPELLLNILHFCDFPTIREVSCTNKRLHDLIEKNSHRLAKRHVRMTIWEWGQSLSGGEICGAIFANFNGARAFRYQFEIAKADEHEHGEMDKVLPIPDAVRDLIEGLNKAERWQPVDDCSNPGRRLVVSDPWAVAVPVLEDVFKRISIHRFEMKILTTEFSSRVLAVMSKHRQRIHSFHVTCRNAKHLEDAHRMVHLFGAEQLSVSVSPKGDCSVEEKLCFVDALSETKLTFCEFRGSVTVPKCLIVRASFIGIEGVGEVIKEWARGDRKIIHYVFGGCSTPNDEIFAGITNYLQNVREVRLSVLVVKHGYDFLKIENTTLPEDVEHQKALYIYCRYMDVIVVSAPIKSTPYYIEPDAVRPCVECSPSAQLRQAAERLAALHVGIDYDGQRALNGWSF